MLTAVGPAPLAESDIVWEIGGDAASERLRREGLGAFWYGLWWCVPLTSVPGLAALHITGLELIELGLGIVVVTPCLTAVRRIRLVSDALVGVLALRVRLPDGRRAKDAKSRAIVAVHEVIGVVALLRTSMQLNTPQWRNFIGDHGVAHVDHPVVMERIAGDIAVTEPAKPLDIFGLLRSAIQPRHIPIYIQLLD